MNFVKSAAVGLALICVLAIPAIAQGVPAALEDGSVLMVSPTGTMMKMHPSQTVSDTLAKEGTPLPAGVMIHRRGGKLYVVQDKKMPNGKMLSETMTQQ